MEKKRYNVAVTGSSGSGKTTVIEMLQAMGFQTVDLDTISVNMIAEDKTVQNRLNDILPFQALKEGKLDLKKIGSYFDQHQDEEEVFETWFQPYLGGLIKDDLSRQNTDGPVFFDAPFLKERNLLDSFDEIWVIYATEETCRKRIMKRNGYSEEKASYLVRRSLPKINRKRERKITWFSNHSDIQKLQENIETEVHRLHELFE